MKKIFLFFMSLMFIMCLAGCINVNNKLENYNIDNNEFYSIFIKQGQESTYFVKGIDVNGESKLIRAYSEKHSYTKQDGANIVSLPNEVKDFNFCGVKNLKENFEFLMFNSNDDSYVYRKKENSGPYGVYEIIKVNYSFKNKVRNIAYISSLGNYNEYMFNENIKLFSIKIDEFNNTYLQSYNKSLLLLEDVDVINSFFMIDYYDAEYSYYPFIIISNKVVYFYVVNNEMELICNNKYYFDESIIDYNFCCTYNVSNTIGISSYFYIISENNMHIYNSEGNEIEVITVDDNLINVNINYKYNTETECNVLIIDLVYSGLEEQVIELNRKEIIV
ncbi:MAG: hypothetical protein ACOX40_01745 [Bacilli bacterium]